MPRASCSTLALLAFAACTPKQDPPHDDFGDNIVDGAVHVHDLHATMLHLLGFNHERLTFRHQGRDFRLTNVAGRVVRELLA